jgi:hypothetical protein
VASVSGGFVLTPRQTLGGNGTVTWDVTSFGTLAPGTSIGRLTNNGSATLRGLTIMEVASVGGIWTNDQFIVTGALNYGGALAVSRSPGPMPGRRHASSERPKVLPSRSRFW